MTTTTKTKVKTTVQTFTYDKGDIYAEFKIGESAYVELIDVEDYKKFLKVEDNELLNNYLGTDHYECEGEYRPTAMYFWKEMFENEELEKDPLTAEFLTEYVNSKYSK